MGYSVLYLAFGIVALWLLGEVLLQYKARLRWRLLAFAGFLGVVIGVYERDVIIIVLGALAFGAGQSFVTLSYKRGFSTGWSLGGRPGSSRRRRGGVTEPVLEVSPVEEQYLDEYATARQAGPRDELDADEPDVFGSQRPMDSPQVYQPVQMHEDSGEYPVYDGQSSYTPDPYTSGGYEGYGAQGYAGWGGDPQPAAASYADGFDQPGQSDQSDQSGWGGHQYGYDPGAYQEPATASYGYDTPAGGTDAYSYQQPYGDPQSGHQQQEQPQPQQPLGSDPYGYPYQQQPDPLAQPYIPHQQYQSPYEQQPQQPPFEQPQQEQQPQYAEYADPYDPYRY
jgi:hypothetical protein